MNNKLTLADMLLEQASTLTDDKITGKALETQVKKAQALAAVAEQYVKLKEVTVKETEVNIKGVKTMHDCGLQFTPQGLNIKPLPLEYTTKGTTPEGLEYEL